MIGLDTGFFFRLAEGSTAAIELLDRIIVRDAASLEAVHCTELHTTDNDFDRYVGRLRIVKL